MENERDINKDNNNSTYDSMNKEYYIQENYNNMLNDDNTVSNTLIITNTNDKMVIDNLNTEINTEDRNNTDFSNKNSISNNNINRNTSLRPKVFDLQDFSFDMKEATISNEMSKKSSTKNSNYNNYKYNNYNNINNFMFNTSNKSNHSKFTNNNTNKLNDKQSSNFDRSVKGNLNSISKLNLNNKFHNTGNLYTLSNNSNNSISNIINNDKEDLIFKNIDEKDIIANLDTLNKLNNIDKEDNFDNHYNNVYNKYFRTNSENSNVHSTKDANIIKNNSSIKEGISNIINLNVNNNNSLLSNVNISEAFNKDSNTKENNITFQNSNIMNTDGVNIEEYNVNELLDIDNRSSTNRDNPFNTNNNINSFRYTKNLAEYLNLTKEQPISSKIKQNEFENTILVGLNKSIYSKSPVNSNREDKYDIYNKSKDNAEITYSRSFKEIKNSILFDTFDLSLSNSKNNDNIVNKDKEEMNSNNLDSKHKDHKVYNVFDDENYPENICYTKKYSIKDVLNNERSLSHNKYDTNSSGKSNNYKITRIIKDKIDNHNSYNQLTNNSYISMNINTNNISLPKNNPLNSFKNNITSIQLNNYNVSNSKNNNIINKDKLNLEVKKSKSNFSTNSSNNDNKDINKQEASDTQCNSHSKTNLESLRNIYKQINLSVYFVLTLLFCYFNTSSDFNRGQCDVLSLMFLISVWLLVFSLIYIKIEKINLRYPFINKNIYRETSNISSSNDNLKYIPTKLRKSIHNNNDNSNARSMNKKLTSNNNLKYIELQDMNLISGYMKSNISEMSVSLLDSNEKKQQNIKYMNENNDMKDYNKNGSNKNINSFHYNNASTLNPSNNEYSEKVLFNNHSFNNNNVIVNKASSSSNIKAEIGNEDVETKQDKIEVRDTSSNSILLNPRKTSFSNNNVVKTLNNNDVLEDLTNLKIEINQADCIEDNNDYNDCNTDIKKDSEKNVSYQYDFNFNSDIPYFKSQSQSQSKLNVGSIDNSVPAYNNNNNYFKNNFKSERTRRHSKHSKNSDITSTTNLTNITTITKCNKGINSKYKKKHASLNYKINKAFENFEYLTVIAFLYLFALYLLLISITKLSLVKQINNIYFVPLIFQLAFNNYRSTKFLENVLVISNVCIFTLNNVRYIEKAMYIIEDEIDVFDFYDENSFNFSSSTASESSLNNSGIEAYDNGLNSNESNEDDNRGNIQDKENREYEFSRNLTNSGKIIKVKYPTDSNLDIEIDSDNIKSMNDSKDSNDIITIDYRNNTEANSLTNKTDQITASTTKSLVLESANFKDLLLCLFTSLYLFIMSLLKSNINRDFHPFVVSCFIGLLGTCLFPIILFFNISDEIEINICTNVLFSTSILAFCFFYYIYYHILYKYSFLVKENTQLISFPLIYLINYVLVEQSVSFNDVLFTIAICSSYLIGKIINREHLSYKLDDL